MDKISNNLAKSAARSGLILGLIGIIIILLIYFVNAKLMVNMWVGISILIFSLILVIVFGIGFRRESGGFLSFKLAFVYSLVLLLVAGLVNQTFNFLLFNLIDTELIEIVTNATIENTEAMMERFNAPVDKIDEALEKVESRMANQYTMGGIVKTYLVSILIYGVISLITGAIIKKRNPDEVI